MQTILGSGGAIGIELAKALPEYTDRIRLVSRNPLKVNPSDETFPADLTDAMAVKNAVKDSDVAYLTAGLQYDTRTWQTSWPKIMQNVIDACKLYNCKLVFFDNIYMYDPAHLGHMTENTPVNPVSVKGTVRAKLAGMITDEIRDGKLQALIARSADFYGPGNLSTSMLTQTVIQPISLGKTANWLGSVKYRHSFTFTPDAGRATAILGNTEEAFGQVWHLPTARDPLTGQEWIENVAQQFGVKPRFRTAPRFMVRIMGLFIPVMREMVEMIYQYDRDYVFISDKFESHFDFQPTSCQEGLRIIIENDFT